MGVLPFLDDLKRKDMVVVALYLSSMRRKARWVVYGGVEVVMRLGGADGMERAGQRERGTAVVQSCVRARTMAIYRLVSSRDAWRVCGGVNECRAAAFCTRREAVAGVQECRGRTKSGRPWFLGKREASRGCWPQYNVCSTSPLFLPRALDFNDDTQHPLSSR